MVVLNAAAGDADRLPGLAGLDRAVQLLRHRRPAGPDGGRRDHRRSAIAGYVFLDRGDPVGALPGIVIHFLVAMVVGELSSRRTRAAAAEARRAAESREQALAAERPAAPGARPAGARAARLARPHGQRDGAAGGRGAAGVRRQPGLRAGGAGRPSKRPGGRRSTSSTGCCGCCGPTSRVHGRTVRADGDRPRAARRADPGDGPAGGAAGRRRRPAGRLPPGRCTGSCRRR